MKCVKEKRRKRYKKACQAVKRPMYDKEVQAQI